MSTRFLAFAIAAALGLHAHAHADEAAPPYTVTGNLTITSDYRFRGISQTFGEDFDAGPAVQGGIDYASSSGFYLGSWDSSSPECSIRTAPPRARRSRSGRSAPARPGTGCPRSTTTG